MWFGGRGALQMAEGSLVVRASDELALAFVRKNFDELIRQSVVAVAGLSCPVSYEVADEPRTHQGELFAAGQLEANVPHPERLSRSEGEGTLAPAPSPRLAPSAHGVEPATTNATASHARAARARKTPPRTVRTRRTAPHSDPSETPLFAQRAAPAIAKSAPCSFHFGADNIMLETAVRQVIAHPGKFNPLVLVGPTGCGKTHLLQTVISAARDTGTRRRCLFQTAEQFTCGFIEALQGKGLPVFRGKYRQLDLLALDDLQFFAGKRATLVEFQNTVETLLRGRRQIVVTADRPLHEMEFLGESLRTRLSCGMTCPVGWPDQAAREAIAADHVREQEFEPVPETLRMVCRHMGRDVRMLKGAINRLQAATLALGRAIDPDTATELLGDLFQSQAPAFSLERIERAVCEVCGVTPDDLRGQKRLQRISHARCLAMWLSRRHTNAGLAEIGEYYGGRNHSTVVAARKRLDELARSDSEISVSSQKMRVSAALARLEDRLAAG
jgi:chromosomal replication initiator protein